MGDNVKVITKLSASKQRVKEIFLRFGVATSVLVAMGLVTEPALASTSKVATSVTTTAGDKQVTVGFVQPDLTPDGQTPGALTLSGYTIKVFQGGVAKGTSVCVETTNTTESCIVTAYVLSDGTTSVDLSNGTAYTFTVIARWSDGSNETQSDESAISSSATPFTKPSQPLAPTVAVNATTATTADISWIAPQENGESIDLYTVSVFNKAGTTTATDVTGCTSSTLTCSVTGLSRGTAYTFKVKAQNDAGDSEVSPVSASFTVSPGAPTNVATAKIISGTSVTIDVTWAEPASNVEPISGYSVRATDGTNTITKQWTTGDLKASFTASTSGADLTLGTRYTFSVLATNAGGDGLVASPTPADLVPSRAPDAPSTPTTTFSGTTATVSWSVLQSSATGGEAITEYTGAAFPSSASDTTGTPLGTCVSSAASNCAITALTPNTAYKFAVKAKNNANGYGPYSALSTSVTSPVAVVAPGAPSGVAATFSGTTATVTWLAPGSNGGQAISEYTAAAFPSAASNTNGTPTGTCTSLSALTCLIQNLSYGTSYKFAVKAKNDSAGYGAFSSLSNSVTSPAAPVQENPPSNTPVTETPTVSPPASTPTVTPTPPVTETTAPPAITAPPATTVAPVATSTPTASPSSASTLSGTPVNISRQPSSAISSNTEIAVSSKTVKLLLEVPKSKNAKSQVTKYVIELKPTKGPVIRKTITVKPGQTVKPSISGKAKTTYTISVTAIQKSGKKSVWKGPKVSTK